MELKSGIFLDDAADGIRPQDDLFRYVNGAWIERTDIPADKARYGSFAVLAEDAERAVHEILIAAQGAQAGSEPRKLGDLFTSFMDEESIERRGIAPVEGFLERIADVDSTSEFLGLLGELERAGVPGLYGVFVDSDPGNPERYVVFLEQGGLSLPDERYYREDHFAEIRAGFVAHVENMLLLAAQEDAGRRAKAVFDLETAIATQHWDNVKSRDSVKTYNLMSWENFIRLGRVGGESELDLWRGGLDVAQEIVKEVVVRQPSFTEGLASLLASEKLDAWKDWLTWRVIHAGAPFLPDAFVQENFAFYGAVLSGTEELRQRWKRGVGLVEGAMGEAIGRIYVEQHFPSEAKEKMDVLVAHLLEAYRQRISTLEWMTPTTRRRALDKLAKFTPKIGYPDEWRDYSSLVVDPEDLWGNVSRVAEFTFARELGKIGKPIDRKEWFMTPQTINAYYNPGFNEIVFPAAILQFPFFELTRDDAANYGAIGAVIGHEIGHGFDDEGSKYDGDGRLTDWWTTGDRTAFEERTRALIGQYDALSPAQTPDRYVNGALTIGENIGDLGGLGIAWTAYQLSLGGAEAPVIEGLTGAQRFFLSWAQAWREKRRDEEMVRLLAIDPHSPSEFRCNQVVRNLDPFHEAFDVREGDSMWMDPSERVRIW